LSSNNGGFPRYGQDVNPRKKKDERDIQKIEMIKIWKEETTTPKENTTKKKSNTKMKEM